MRTISLSDLRERAKSRPAGYIDDVLSRALIVTPTHYTISEDAYLDLAKKYQKRSFGGNIKPVELATYEERDRREAACRSCKHYKENKCELCGCGAEAMAARWAKKSGACADTAAPKW